MSTRSRQWLTVCTAVLTAALVAEAWAQRQPSIIRPPDDRRDYFEVGTEDQALGNSVCALIPNAETSDIGQGLRNNGDGTFTLVTDSLEAEQGPLCDGEPFASQPIGANCSVTLVGADVVVTAGHCLEQEGGVMVPTENWYLVFDYVMRDENTNPTEFTTAQVYTIRQVIGSVNDENTANDWAVIRLDRAVEGDRTPIPVRQSGDPEAGTPIVAIGFGAGLPMKFSANARIQSLIDFGFEADLDIIEGNSGCGVFNQTTRQLEGVLSNDIDAPDFTDDPQGNCRRATRCPDDDVCSEGFTQICKVTEPAFQAALRTAGVLTGDTGNGDAGDAGDTGDNGDSGDNGDPDGDLLTGGTMTGVCGAGSASLLPLALLGLWLVRAGRLRRFR